MTFRSAGSVRVCLTAAALAAALLAAYGLHAGSKQLRKMKRHMALSLVKQKFKSLFSRRAEGISTRTLIYILLAVAFLALLAIEPPAHLRLWARALGTDARGLHQRHVAPGARVRVRLTPASRASHSIPCAGVGGRG